MVRFLILRHGESVTNQSRTYTGQNDAPLTETGHAQARAVAEYLKNEMKVDEAWSSDLCRAADTARPFAEAMGYTLHTDPALREIDVGLWQGKGFDEIRPTEEYRYMTEDPWLHPFGVTGERYLDVFLRSDACLRRIAEGKDGKTILVATHGGTLRAMLHGWNDEKDSFTRVRIVNNASITTVEYDGERFYPTEIGVDFYLKDLITKYTEAH